MRPTGVPTYGESEASVISTRLAPPWRKVNNRTSSPTLTASSTRADMIRGVETLTSTPQASVNSHSLSGWLTRPTVRGTPNSVLASSEVTRLALSSPVAAIAMSYRSSCASSREASSHASARSHSASGSRSVRMDRGSLSMSSTWWPLASSSVAIERPTAPAPAMATRISVLLRAGLQGGVHAVGVLLAHHQVHHVALLDDRLPGREHALAQAVDPRDPAAGLLLEVDRPGAHPRLRHRDLIEADGAGRVAERRLGAHRQQAAQHLVGRPTHGRHRGDAEPLEHLGATGVVDPGHHLLQPECLARHARGDDVGVVAAGDRGERPGALDARLGEHPAVEPHPGDLLAVEVRAEAAEGGRVGVDHGDRVVAVLQGAGEGGADAAAAHDHDVHGGDATPGAARGAGGWPSLTPWVSPTSPSASCWGANCGAPRR